MMIRNYYITLRWSSLRRNHDQWLITGSHDDQGLLYNAEVELTEEEPLSEADHRLT